MYKQAYLVLMIYAYQSFFKILSTHLILKYLILGDGKDEEVAARNMNFPFWRIQSHNDLVAFYNALDMGFM